jgi:tRNA-Thr(GGU) m(6)t(6)A37 methyltransferase TsaA
MQETYSIKPVGIVRKREDKIWIEIFDEFADALLGLDGFSHIYVLYWFHQNDRPEKRRTLQVHPRKDPANPLTGVFATHSPQRPNLIALTLCRIEAISGNKVQIADIDAADGSPVIDIKCYIPGSVPDADVRLPAWVGK